MYRLCFVLIIALIPMGCSSDPLEEGRLALEGENFNEAVTHLRSAVDANAGDEETSKLYKKALTTFYKKLRRPSASQEMCDGAVEALAKIDGFGQGETWRDGEYEVINQALNCAARHRVHGKNVDEAINVVVERMKRFPGFDPSSPSLAKAFSEPALDRARKGQVTETTALAQVIFSSGKRRFALSILELLESSGAGSSDILAALTERVEKASNSNAATGLAAGYALWNGSTQKSLAWYEGLEKRSSGDPNLKTLHRFTKLRHEEAKRVVESKNPACEVVSSNITVVSKVKSIPALAGSSTDDGFLVAWIEGDKAPEQSLKSLRVGLDGSKGSQITIAQTMPAIEKSDGGRSAYDPKNREVSLAMMQCGKNTEVIARGAPERQWTQTTLDPSGAISSKMRPVPPLGGEARMPQEDVWWNLACSNDQLMHIWLADTQVMRMAWFENGAPVAEPTHMRIPGFAPWFVAAGRENNETILVWIDIMGEDLAQLLKVVIPEDRTIPMKEDESGPDFAPIVESIGARVEQLRLTPIGDRLAATFYPKQQEITVRWMDFSGRPLGSVTPLVRSRGDEIDLRFEAASAGGRLGIGWTEKMTDDWADLYFQSFSPDDLTSSQSQHISGLVDPAITPVVFGSQNVFALAWVDRSEQETESVSMSILRCSGN